MGKYKEINIHVQEMIEQITQGMDVAVRGSSAYVDKKLKTEAEKNRHENFLNDLETILKPFGITRRRK